jgi:uncharacterized protein (TIGR03435 family)
VYDFQVSGPKWIDVDRYDLEAKAAGEAPHTKAQLREMLRRLLADRFALGLRRETKVLPVYALETGSGGAILRRAKNPADPMVFRVFQRRQIISRNAPLEHLTDVLTWLLGKPVLDRTGLEGSFDYDLEWSPDEVQLNSQEAPPDPSLDKPSLASVLQKQLGLRLVPRRDAVETIFVEKAERPTAN